MNHEQLIYAVVLFIPAALGHRIGDYLLQSKWMALTKAAPGLRGAWACTVHVMIYTTAVCATLWIARGEIEWWLWLVIAIPHWTIDRWYLGAQWLKAIRGRTFEAARDAAEGPLRPFEIAFFAVVYAETDETLHLLCLWATVLWLAA